MVRIKITVLLLALVMILSFCSCQKENDYGYVHVVVKYNGQVIPQPTIYMKSGTSINPNIPLSQYDKYIGGDASGQATFENVPAGNYYFYAKAYVNSISSYVSGGTNVKIVSRWRENVYELSIDTN